MTNSTLAFFHTIPGLFLLIIAGGTALYLSVASVTYWFFFIRHRERYLPEYEADPAEIRRALKWAMISVVGNAALTAPIHYLVASGRTAVYFDVDDYGIPWLVASVFIYLFITETMIYWIHRGLHHRTVYKLIHLKHHEFRKPIPFAGISFNPLDAFLQALPHHLCALFLPIHVGVYLVMLTFVAIWAILIHDRVSLVRNPYVLYTGHHTIHHHFNKHNYGQFFTFWDRIGGTYMSPFEQPEKFVRPRLEPATAKSA